LLDDKNKQFDETKTLKISSLHVNSIQAIKFRKK